MIIAGTDRRRWLSGTSTLALLKDIILVASGLVGFLVILNSLRECLNNDNAKHEWRRSCYCGNSTAEARTLGCEYDPLSAAWLPAHCRDDDLTAEFMNDKDGPWEYWADHDHQKPLTLLEVGELGAYSDLVHGTLKFQGICTLIGGPHLSSKQPRCFVSLDR